MEYFRLEIDLPDDVKVEEVSTILGFRPTIPRSEDGDLWMVENEAPDEEPEDGWVHYITKYCESVRHGIADLERLGISSDYISIWMLYEYDQQCNMEFTPDEMKAIGDLGITFCISCWAK